MLTLGIDPGTASTGYGLITEKNGKLVFVDYGVIYTSTTESSQGRLRIIYNELKRLIKDYKPQIVAIEKVFFGKNVKTAISVGAARGMTLLAAAEGKIQVAEYTPLEVKIAITGYGRADKKQIQAMVKQLLGLSFLPKPDDAADALAIAICHQHSCKLTSL
ncbi:crossover junction endodeoxyribonuclease RuvC [candidate division WOR-1 bacterium RIFCSPLOWO2_02_FULL_46_20]|uniref:Crossover junction endodeoxyribonuclease RuvC n=2 Tax=Saganbacteria TaxID=1703751 RepID=A0A1F4RBK0_UNCSA|nr:MAG: crossover junction endodeoxyribonuclease RuvC [candidate division WOR-1 bacterium RIFCSPHIGHO2_02_FULL_45_12]OGC05555.1 MAG: crossover junction endodeoxyribonuclease RuvC [candidate division WOR-1 bacterium RIFCSPLOWO2_02_FULL_46_20]OGC09077.1 MAG: crossover junction endodeoxyribonuclease RuvC [candidate division WOR-1 bacterium RIFCSPLOWO2_12_FULL_45_9]